MKSKHLKIVLFFCMLFTFLSCKKHSEYAIVLSGKVIDAQTLLPISNYALSLNFIDGTSGWGGPNFGSYHDIVKRNTNKSGEYVLATDRTYGKDSKDRYEIESFGNNTYFGTLKKLNAQSVDSIKSNAVEDIKVYKRMTIILSCRHLGAANLNDNINVVVTGIYNYRNSFYSGKDSLITDNIDVVPNSATSITRAGIKNNVRFGPISDTIIFTNNNNTYNISY